jgi:hypothetical protein
MHIPTGRVITRGHVTPVPITESVIDAVHALADRERAPQGLKIVNKTGVTLWDSAWIAGVDYDETTFDPIHQSEENDPTYHPDNEDDESEDDEDLDEEEYDAVEPDELAELTNSSTTYDPTTEEEPDDIPNDDVEPEDVQEAIPAAPRVTRELADAEGNLPTIQPGRTRAQSNQTMNAQSHLHAQDDTFVTEYSNNSAYVFSQIVTSLNELNLPGQRKQEFYSFVQNYGLSRGLKKFGEAGRKAAHGEMKQLHDRSVFRPIDVNDLTQREREMAMESLIFLVEKRDKRIKARTCADGRIQRAHMSKQDGTSPTAMTESVLLTAAIDAAEERDVMTADIPNAFVQTDVPKYDGDRIILKIRGPLVDMLLEIDPQLYRPFVRFENKRKILYCVVLKAIYGMIQSSLLFYQKFKKDVESIGFKINPYDPCVANRTINGKQHTITWHVDDLKSSHVDPKVNDQFYDWLTQTYAKDQSVGQVKAVRGKRHDYLAMVLDFTEPKVLKVDMSDYIKGMVEEFPMELKPSKYPWDENLFKVDKKSPLLPDEDRETFHTFTMKGLFVAKRGRQDISPSIAFLSTRVREPTQQDWSKLVKTMRFLAGTAEDVPRFEVEKMNTLHWYVDASFAVHPDMKSHTGMVMTMGKGSLLSLSTKQKVNARSSTEAELVSLDDMIAKSVWAKRFMEAQDC